jgi:hypothetical protein
MSVLHHPEYIQAVSPNGIAEIIETAILVSKRVQYTLVQYGFAFQ